MTNIERVADIVCDITSDAYLVGPISKAIADATPPLLMPDPQIICTVAELEALDPDTLLHASERDYYAHAWGFNHYRLPAVVVATADQVRAARKALEEA